MCMYGYGDKGARVVIAKHKASKFVKRGLVFVKGESSQNANGGADGVVP